ncbi:MAG: rhomboid family intramembrane serine protease, partial [Rhodanobacteraceae bacterium]
ASGIAQGLMFFIFAMGLLRRERLAIIASMVVFFLYGSMVYGVLPQDPRVSYEYHLFGSLCGLLSAFFLFRLDAMPPRRTYSWDQAGEDQDRDDRDDTPFSVLQERAERAATTAAEQSLDRDSA